MKSTMFILFAFVIFIPTLLGNSVQDNLVSNDVLKTGSDTDESDGIDLSYLKCTSKECELVKASIKELPQQGPWEVMTEVSHTRTKRRIFLPDNRLRVRANSVLRFPFNSAVAIRVDGSVVCSGVALQPRFFLTAAHCIQRGGRWKDGHPNLEVGVLYKNRTMHWAKVTDSRVPSIWKRRKASKKLLRLKDYAVLETKTPLPVSPMQFSYVGVDEETGKESLQVNTTYMYLNAFDDEKRPYDLNMRFCLMKKINQKRIYNKCDTVPKTAGAGVYVRMRNKVTGKVERKVIAIATGDYGVKVDQGYSVALRINSRMFPHICHMLTGSFNKCPWQ